MPEDHLPRIPPVEWRDGVLRILDQTLLPGEARYIDARTHGDVAHAIRRLAVRGAPLIGIAAAYGLALAARRGDDLRAAGAELEATRPTAVNLRWAVRRALAAGDDAPAIEAEARRIHEEQIESDARSGALGAELIASVVRAFSPRATRLLTHCNTGSLATGGIGSALGVIKTAHRRGQRIEVLVDETRPLLQGSRLTAWELEQEGIPYRIIVDGAAAGLIAGGNVDAVLVGADRIAADGDTANKIGTYGLALAARAHGVPFYVVAPVSTIDSHIASGDDIPMEHRADDEVLEFAGARAAPAGASALNPAFDITPASLITAIVTERGIAKPPSTQAIEELVGAGDAGAAEERPYAGRRTPAVRR